MGEFFVYSFFAGIVFLLFPIVADVDLYLDAQENRGWFSVSLYHRLRLFGGYAQLKPEGIVFHLTKKKALILPYAEMADARKKFELTRGFQICKYHQVLEFGGAHDARSILIAALFSAFGSAAYAMIREKYAFLSFRSGVIFHTKPCLKGSIRVAAVMNGLVLGIALLKKSLEELIKWMKKRKSTVSLKRLRKNLRVSST